MAGWGGVTHLFTHRGLCRKKRSFYLHVVVASCVFECSRSHLHSCDRAAAVKVTQTGGNVMAAFKIIMCTAGAYLYERQGLHYCGREAQVQVWEKRGRGEGFCFFATHHLLHFLTHTQPKIFQTSRLPRNKEPLEAVDPVSRLWNFIGKSSLSHLSDWGMSPFVTAADRDRVLSVVEQTNTPQSSARSGASSHVSSNSGAAGRPEH